MLIIDLIAFGQDPVNYTVRNKTLLLLDRPEGRVLAKIPRNKTISMISYNLQCDCFNAKYLEFEGIITSKMWLEDLFGKSLKKKKSDDSLSDSVVRLLTEYRLATDKESEVAFTIEKNGVTETGLDKTVNLITKWGYTNGKRIAEKKIWIGMSVDMTLESWGIPYRVSRNQGNWGMREQWIYSEAYLFFENGILTEIFRINAKE